MLGLMKQYMKKKYNYEISDFAYFEVPEKQGYFIKTGWILFGITVILYVIDLFTGWNAVTLFIVFFAFVLFVLLPMLTRSTVNEQGIFVTKDCLIQPISKKEYVAIFYDDIVSFRMTSRGIFISDAKQTIILSLEMYRDEIDQIMQILEAKGKTFDSKREFMIRPVEISFDNNKVILIDLETESMFDRLYQDYQTKYETLTPRFLDAIDFTNSVVTNSVNDGKNWAMHFEMLKVKEDHPENTQFEPIIVGDAVVVFHLNEFQSIYLKNPHNLEESKEDLMSSLTKLDELLQKAVVLDVQMKNNNLKWMISSGVHLLTIEHKFEDVQVGWDKTVE